MYSPGYWPGYYSGYSGYCPCCSYYTGFYYPTHYYAAYPAYYYSYAPQLYYGGVVYAAPSPPRGEYKYGNCLTIC